MAKVIDASMFDDILASGPRDWISQKEEDGEIRVVFTTPIAVIEPGDTDLSEREWNPPTEDANGNPYIEKFGPNKGNPVIPWAKVEAQCTVNGLPKTYSFGRKSGSCLRSIIAVMREHNIDNEDLPGTKWSITRVGSYDWKVEYLGREETSSQSSSPKNDEDVNKITEVLKELKSKNSELSKGVSKEQIVQTVNLLAGISEETINKKWNTLLDKKIIEKVGDKIKVL